MSLRHKDDWDEALEESRNKAIARGDIKPEPPFVPSPDYDYGVSFKFTLRSLDEDTQALAILERSTTCSY